jgi:uncharacterized membrane protein
MTYVLKFWAATVLLSPIPITLFLGLKSIFSYFEMFYLMVMMGAFFALPTVVIQALAIIVMKRAARNAILIKIALSIVAVLGTYISFYLLKVSFIEYLGPFVYSVIMVCSIWYFRLGRDERKPLA